jgi:hypothetical protein
MSVMLYNTRALNINRNTSSVTIVIMKEEYIISLPHTLPEGTQHHYKGAHTACTIRINTIRIDEH